MPKEYINPPSREEVENLQRWLGMPESEIDGKIGPETRKYWDKDIEDHYDRSMDQYTAVSPLPMVALHWDGQNGTIQLSLDVDWDVLQEMVKTRQENPDSQFADDNSFLRNRVTFYTGSLNRNALQHLVRTTRRARNAVFGADE